MKHLIGFNHKYHDFFLIPLISWAQIQDSTTLSLISKIKMVVNQSSLFNIFTGSEMVFGRDNAEVANGSSKSALVFHLLVAHSVDRRRCHKGSPYLVTVFDV